MQDAALNIQRCAVTLCGCRTLLCQNVAALDGDLGVLRLAAGGKVALCVNAHIAGGFHAAALQNDLTAIDGTQSEICAGDLTGGVGHGIAIHFRLCRGSAVLDGQLAGHGHCIGRTLDAFPRQIQRDVLTGRNGHTLSYILLQHNSIAGLSCVDGSNECLVVLRAHTYHSLFCGDGGHSAGGSIKLGRGVYILGKCCLSLFIRGRKTALYDVNLSLVCVSLHQTDDLTVACRKGTIIDLHRADGLGSVGHLLNDGAAAACGKAAAIDGQLADIHRIVNLTVEDNRLRVLIVSFGLLVLPLPL